MDCHCFAWHMKTKSIPIAHACSLRPRRQVHGGSTPIDASVVAAALCSVGTTRIVVPRHRVDADDDGLRVVCVCVCWRSNDQTQTTKLQTNERTNERTHRTVTVGRLWPTAVPLLTLPTVAQWRTGLPMNRASLPPAVLASTPVACGVPRVLCGRVDATD